MRSLETFVVVDAIPYDIHLTDEQEQSLRKQVRSLLEATPNDELFSAAVIPRLEELAATFLGRLENRD
jgi:hypothetical protein